jgi:glucosamine-phosphate N-acetyltransferase
MILNAKDLILDEKYYNQILDLYSIFTKFDRNIMNYIRLKTIFENLPENHFIKFYLDKENNIIGAITLIIEQKIIHNGQCVGHIEDFVVLEKEQKKGLGSLLLEHALQIAKQKNCYKVILDCHPLLENYYIKKGFSRKGNNMGLYF